MKKITIPQDGVESILGHFDENLRMMEEVFTVRLSVRGGDFTVEGEQENEEKVANLLNQLSGLVQSGATLRREDIASGARLVQRDADVSLPDYFVRHQVKTQSGRRVYPRSANQAAYIDAIRASDMVFGIGPAGTGKTFLAMAMAVELLSEGKVDRIVLARPAVEAGEKLGFLPGDLAEKVNPYLRPLYDSLYNLVDRSQAEAFLEKGVVEIAPLAFMRGRTLSNAFVILDEAQNCTTEQMKMLLTRIGFDTQVAITGDITQIDLPPGKVSGLVEAEAVVSSIQGIRFIYFEQEDVVRHPLVKKIIAAYESHDNRISGKVGGREPSVS